MNRYVVVGNGVAGTKAAEAASKTDPGCAITLIGEEHIPFYSRIRLIDFLAGEASEEEIIIRRPEWHKEHGIDLRIKAHVKGIDASKKSVVLSDGEALPFDRLLIATGATSFVPPVKGSELSGVFTLRNIADAKAILSYLKGPGSVMMIGGGLLGLETANALRKRGHDVTVVEFFPRLLPRQMDPDGAGILKGRLEDMGLRFRIGATSKEITGDGRAENLTLEDGSTLAADMIIFSAGVRPDFAIAKEAGIEVNKGILVDDSMKTSTGDIYAAGDCTEHRGICYGIWPAADAQGTVAGTNMAGGSETFQGIVPSNVLKVTGIDLVSAGNIDPENKCRTIVHKGDGYYKKLVIENSCISGCILFGDTEGRGKILKAIQDKRDMTAVLDRLEHWDLSVL